ncbi:MAG: transposase [Cytophagaceae bacterium]|nr:transposase [Cytophagaceae bacterium]
MELTQVQYDQIADCFPKHRGSLTYSNLHVINTFLYICENGCKWRALPEKFGNWHTI